jgi:hypothetical protein
MFGAATLNSVQRLFSMFPGGTAGAALLLLRVSVAMTLVVDRTANCPSVASSWALLVILLPALSLIVGLFTPYGAIACGLIQLAVLVQSGGSHGFHIAMFVLNCVTVALLGPGAYSVDARLFGLQLLIIPPSNQTGAPSKRFKGRGPRSS